MITQKTTKVKKKSPTQFDKKRQRLAFRTISAIRAASKTNLIFFILTVLVYIAMVYKVVSVEPIIVDAIKPYKTIYTRVFHYI